MNRANKRKISQGFTLVEIMVAASVLAILFYFVYLLFASFARTQEMGHWNLTTIKQLRNGLTLLRNEIGRATYPEVVTQKGSEAFDTGNGDLERFLYVPAVIPFETEAINIDQKLIQFFMCRPGRSSLPGTTDIGPELITGTLSLEGGKLRYRRTIESQPAEFEEKISEISQIIADNLSKIEISTKEVPATEDLSVSNKNFLVISLTARHPRYTNTIVRETIEAPFEVDVKRGDFP